MRCIAILLTLILFSFGTQAARYTGAPEGSGGKTSLFRLKTGETSDALCNHLKDKTKKPNLTCTARETDKLMVEVTLPTAEIPKEMKGRPFELGRAPEAPGMPTPLIPPAPKAAVTPPLPSAKTATPSEIDQATNQATATLRDQIKELEGKLSEADRALKKLGDEKTALQAAARKAQEGPAAPVGPSPWQFWGMAALTVISLVGVLLALFAWQKTRGKLQTAVTSAAVAAAEAQETIGQLRTDNARLQKEADKVEGLGRKVEHLSQRALLETSEMTVPPEEMEDGQPFTVPLVRFKGQGKQAEDGNAYFSWVYLPAGVPLPKNGDGEWSDVAVLGDSNGPPLWDRTTLVEARLNKESFLSAIGLMEIASGTFARIEHPANS